MDLGVGLEKREFESFTDNKGESTDDDKMLSWVAEDSEGSVDSDAKYKSTGLVNFGDKDIEDKVEDGDEDAEDKDAEDEDNDEDIKEDDNQDVEEEDDNENVWEECATNVDYEEDTESEED
jgi:hypothetical protein